MGPYENKYFSDSNGDYNGDYIDVSQTWNFNKKWNKDKIDSFKEFIKYYNNINFDSNHKLTFEDAKRIFGDVGDDHGFKYDDDDRGLHDVDDVDFVDDSSTKLTKEERIAMEESARKRLEEEREKERLRLEEEERRRVEAERLRLIALEKEREEILEDRALL